MQNALKSNEWQRNCAQQTFKIEIQKGAPNNSDFLQNWFSQEIRSLFFFPLCEKYSLIMQNALKPNEWRRNCVHQTFAIKIQKGERNKSHFLQNWFPQEIRSFIFYLSTFQASKKRTAEPCRMHSNLMRDNEFGSIKLLKLKYRRGHQIIQTFCKMGSPQKLGPPSLICWTFKTLWKVLLDHAECIET